MTTFTEKSNLSKRHTSPDLPNRPKFSKRTLRWRSRSQSCVSIVRGLSIDGSLLYLQSFLQGFAGGFLVRVEGVTVDVQSGAGLGVAQETGDGGHVGPARNEKAGVRMTE